MNIETSPLTPDIVSCCQVPVAAVQLPDRHIVATIQSLCEPFQLNRWAQIRRIRDNKFLSRYLFLVPIVTKGGWQQMETLASWAIPTWLGGLQLNKLAPDKQEIVLAFQAEIVDALHQHFSALHQHFSKKVAGPTAQQGAAPEKMQPLYRSALEMHIEAWQETAQELDAREERYETRLAVVEQQLARVMAQVAALEQRDGGARGEEPPQQAGRILSQGHIGQVYVLARHQRDQTGEPISDLLRDLAETFDVPDMSDIPDEGWDHILRWFRGRTQR